MAMNQPKNQVLDKDYLELTILKRELLEENKNIPITLFLGAGINENILPNWHEIIDELLKATIIRLLSSFNHIPDNISDLISWTKSKFSVYDQAILIKSILKDNYISILRSFLYKNTNEDAIKNSEFLKAIASLCCIKRVKCVITYNWDDLLETILKQKEYKITPYSVFKEPMIPPIASSLPIYHVHGFLPRITPYLISDSNQIVFSLDEYTKFNTKITSWQTTIQLYALQNTACIFIGTSLRDMNMLRLINTAHSACENKFIYYIGSKEVITEQLQVLDFQDAALNDAKLDIFNKFLNTLKVKLIITDEDIPTLITNIFNQIKED